MSLYSRETAIHEAGHAGARLALVGFVDAS
jgi:hypothetical protein